MPSASAYEEVARRFRDAAYGLSPREVAKESGLDQMAVRDIIEEVDKGQFTVDRRAGTVRKMEAFIRKRQANSGDARNDRPDVDIERVYEEFEAPEDRLLAIEGIAAVNRSRAQRSESAAAKIRARATYLAERRAALICRKIPTDDGAPRHGRDEEAEQVTVTPDPDDEASSP